MITMDQVAGYKVGANTYLRSEQGGYAYNRAWRRSQETGERIVAIAKVNR
jgi:hypothetical protein